jgi:hypothetical protein
MLPTTTSKSGSWLGLIVSLGAVHNLDDTWQSARRAHYCGVSFGRMWYKPDSTLSILALLVKLGIVY